MNGLVPHETPTGGWYALCSPVYPECHANDTSKSKTFLMHRCRSLDPMGSCTKTSRDVASGRRTPHPPEGYWTRNRQVVIKMFNRVLSQGGGRKAGDIEGSWPGVPLLEFRSLGVVAVIVSRGLDTLIFLVAQHSSGLTRKTWAECTIAIGMVFVSRVTRHAYVLNVPLEKAFESDRNLDTHLKTTRADITNQPTVEAPLALCSRVCGR